MVTVQIPFVLDQILELQAPYFEVHGIGNNAELLLSQQDDILPVQAQQKLQTFLQNCRGRVKISLCTKSKKQKGEGGKVDNYHYYVDTANTYQNAIAGNVTPGPSPLQNPSIDLLMQLVNQNKDSEIARIKSEYDFRFQLLEMKAKDKDTGINGVIEKVATLVIDKLTTKPQTIPVQISGSQDTPITVDEQQTIFDTAMQRWFAADEDCLQLIVKIADLAQNKPEMYQMYKPIILKA